MTDTKVAEPSQAGGFDVFGFVARFAPTLFLIVLMLLFAIVEPRFLSSINLFNVMRQVSITGLLAVGMTFVILTAGIDLSIGSLVAFAGLVAAAVSKGGVSNRFTVGAGQEAASHGWYLAALAAIGIDLKRQPPQRTAILTIGLQDSPSVSRKDCEDALHRIIAFRERRVDHHRP